MASVPDSRRVVAPRVGALAALAAGFVAVAALVYGGLREVSPAVLLVAGTAAAASLVYMALARPRPVAGGTDDAVTGLRARAQLVSELDQLLAADDATPTLILILDLNGFKDYNDNFGRAAGDALLTRLAERLTSAVPPDGSVFRLHGDEFCVLAPVGEGDAERLIDAATSALELEGEGFRIGCSFGGVLVPYEAANSTEAFRLADERLAGQRRTKQGVRALNALVEALSAQTGATALRTRVESLSVAIGGLLGIHGSRLETLAKAAQLHDLGRLSIPSEILDKPGALDEREWAFVRDQTLVGERLLRTAPHLSDVAPIVRATYENWDGSGYPDGLSGENIPVAARIIRVCHAFDAMLSSRAHRPALAPGQALAEIERLAGTSFDPAVVEVLDSLVLVRLQALDAA